MTITQNKVRIHREKKEKKEKNNIRFVVSTKCKTALVGTALCIMHAV